MAATKRRRIQEMIGLGGVSDATIHDILGRLQSNPIEGPVSREMCNRAVRASITDIDSVEAHLLSGGTMKWTHLHPLQLLRKCFN